MELIALAGPALASAGSFLASNALPIAATGLSAAGTIFEGAQQREAADFEAKQLKTQAGQEVAIAQRSAFEKKREAELANSRNLAVAAGSGAGASDPTVINIMADVENQGLYNALTEMYSGFSKRNDLIAEAKIRKAEGKAAFGNSLISAAGTVFGDYMSAKRHNELMMK